MKATLIGYTQPAETFTTDVADVQEFIAYCAMVNNPDVSP